MITQPRVTSGKAKGRKLSVPDVEGIRVAQDKFKLALFSILGEKIIDSVCLDLYAGAGSFGIEALSRGASSCDFVDENKSAVEVIKDNLRVCGFDKQSQTFWQDAIKFVANTLNKYDVSFIDPFYSNTAHKFLIKNLEEILNSGGIVAFSHGKGIDISKLIEDTEFEIYTQRKFGNAFLSVLQNNKKN